MKRLALFAIAFTFVASLQGAKAPFKFPAFPENLPTEDFDMLRVIIQESTAGTDPSETKKAHSPIETPSFRRIADDQKIQSMYEDESSSDSDDDMSDEAYFKRHRKGEKRERKEDKAIERMFHSEQAKLKKRAANWRRQAQDLKIQCNACGKWHSVPKIISLKEFTAMQANKKWTCWEISWDDGERFCSPFDKIYFDTSQTSNSTK